MSNRQSRCLPLINLLFLHNNSNNSHCVSCGSVKVHILPEMLTMKQRVGPSIHPLGQSFSHPSCSPWHPFSLQQMTHGLHILRDGANPQQTFLQMWHTALNQGFYCHITFLAQVCFLLTSSVCQKIKHQHLKPWKCWAAHHARRTEREEEWSWHRNQYIF